MCKLGIPQNDWKRSDAIPYCEGELSSLRCSRWDSRLSVIWNCFQPTSINSFMCDGKHKGITMKHMIPNVSEWERKKKNGPRKSVVQTTLSQFSLPNWIKFQMNFLCISCELVYQVVFSCYLQKGNKYSYPLFFCSFSISLTTVKRE